MKQIFLMTGEQFQGEVLFEFTDLVLTKYDTSNAELNDQQSIYIAKHLPRELAEVEAFLSRSAALKFTEVTQDVSFEGFWKKYFSGRPADNSSKKRTRAKWDRMTKKEQLKAFEYINKYLNGLANGICPKYAETYLNAELWNN